MDKLERRQRRAARAIAGLTKSTLVEAIEKEVFLDPIVDRLKRAALIKYDRWMRLEADYSRRGTAANKVPVRMKKRDWRR